MNLKLYALDYMPAIHIHIKNGTALRPQSLLISEHAL